MTIQAVRPQTGAQLTVRSSAVGPDGWIEGRFTARGDNLSPPLAWAGAPEGTETFAVVVEDPDAPGDAPFVHWLAWDIPASVTALPPGIATEPRPDQLDGAVQGRNDMGEPGWFGPRPPAGHGVHRYHVQVFALSRRLGMGPDTTLQQLLHALQATTLAAGELVALNEEAESPVIRESRRADMGAPDDFPGQPGAASERESGAHVNPPRT